MAVGRTADYQLRRAVVAAVALAGLVANLRHEPLRAQQAVTWSALTAPPEHLAPGCILAPKVDGIGLHVAENPWIGTDRMTVGAIRARVGGPLRTPDGPVFTAGEASRFRLRLAEGIDDAYVAVYREEESNLVVVYGLRFASLNSKARRSLDESGSPGAMSLVTLGSMVVSVQGGTGACGRSIHAYVRSLSN
jgi:hypothetical protein